MYSYQQTIALSSAVTESRLQALGSWGPHSAESRGHPGVSEHGGPTNRGASEISAVGWPTMPTFGAPKFDTTIRSIHSAPRNQTMRHSPYCCGSCAVSMRSTPHFRRRWCHNISILRADAAERRDKTGTFRAWVSHKYGAYRTFGGRLANNAQCLAPQGPTRR